MHRIAETAGEEAAPISRAGSSRRAPCGRHRLSGQGTGGDSVSRCLSEGRTRERHVGSGGDRCRHQGCRCHRYYRHFGFIDWREVGTFAGNIDQVAESLVELLKPDTAAMLVELAEYAIERLEDALEQVDDSNGEIGGIVCRLGEMHLKACSMAKPDAVALAERLFRFETTLPFGLCSFDAATYRGALG